MRLQLGTGRNRKRLGTLAAAMLVWAACAGLTGCQFFFQCSKASCTDNTTSTTATTNNTGDYAYVANSTAGATYLSGYSIASGALNIISGFPFNLGFVPVAMKVSPNNSFLYVGAPNGGIYLYTIGSSGAITSASNNARVVTSTASLSSMDISPDGNYLFAMDSLGVLLTEFQLNTSTGAISLVTSFTPALTTSAGCALTGSPLSQSCTVRVSPSGNYVAVALNSQGTIVYPYSSSSGITSGSYSAYFACCTNVPSGSGDFSLAFDANNYLYIARTLYLSAYGNLGSSSPTYEGSISYGSSVAPRSVTFGPSYDYVYTANEANGTISGFSVSGAAQLNALSGSPYTGPANVSALGLDNTSTYLIAVGYDGSSGVQLFKLSSGVLGTAVASAASGTSPAYPALVALTH